MEKNVLNTDLTGKVAVVTGAGGVLCSHMAKVLARAGAKVALVNRSDAACLEIPIAVLVNDGSYSAAEFFAAALREYDAAVVVGEHTSGKGHFQYTYELSDGSAVALSTGKYFTPNGLSLEGVGIEPDVPVAVTDEQYSGIYYDQLTPEEDPQIQAALEALK